MNQQSGFTLIELVTVIVILGVLAAFAIPRFSGLETQARIAAVNGLAGSVKSAAALSKALWTANGVAGSTSVTLEGSTAITVGGTTGYPTADANGIAKTVTNTLGYTTSSATNIFEWQLGSALTPASCKVTYNVATTPPITTSTTSGC